jgi:protein-disulfide isomerase
MSSHPSPASKRELRAARAAERKAAEAADRAHALRMRRLRWLGLAAAGAAVVVVLAVVLLSPSGNKDGQGGDAANITGAAAARAVFAGLPERNGIIGSPSAPITLTEFVDPQCPICAHASQATLPTVVEDYVRTGKVQLDVRTLHFIGPDSALAASFAAGARQQGKIWPFLEVLYRNQGAENSGYVTNDFLRAVADASGVDFDKALAYANSGAAQQDLQQAEAQSTTLGVQGTPSFAVSKHGGQPKLLSVDPTKPSALTSALDRELAS